MSNEPNDYQKALAQIMAYGATAPAPTEFPKSPESQQRAIIAQAQADRHRREQERATEAARKRMDDVLVAREQERDKRQRQLALDEKASFKDAHFEAILNAGGTLADAEATLTAAWHAELLRRAQSRRSNSSAAGAL